MQERERGFATVLTPFVFPFVRFPKFRRTQKMKIDVILKLYKDMLFFIKKQTSWNISVVIVAKDNIYKAYNIKYKSVI